MTATATALPRGSSDVVLDRDRVAPAGATGEILQVPLELIDVDANVRKQISDERIAELAASIEEHGVLQPISLRDVAGDRFAINFGQSRFLASQKLGRPTIPAFVDNTVRSAADLSIHQLLENLHRADLPPLDRARAMRAVVDSGVTQAGLARQLGIAASTITNDLGLLDAPKGVQEAIAEGRLTPAHAKAIKGFDAKKQGDLARRAIEEGWSAHQLEQYAHGERQRGEYAREQAAKRENKEARQQSELREKAIELAGKAPLSTAIRVGGYTYGDDGKKAIRLAVSIFEAQGFSDVEAGTSADRAKGFCDCTAWRVEVRWSGEYSFRPACVVYDHQRAKRQAEADAYTAQRELADRVRQRVVTKLAADFRTMPRLALRILVWRSLGWKLEQWATKADPSRSGKKRDPWASLREATDAELQRLALEILGDVNDGQFKVDWQGLADELGIETPA